MSGSPKGRLHGDNGRPDSEAREAYRENKRKQRLPQHQEHCVNEAAQVSRGSSKDEECHKLKEQLQSMQTLLRQLQEKFLQVYNQEDAERKETGEEVPSGSTLGHHGPDEDKEGGYEDD